jgi:glycosyltransferase involved in cell wall biosynthesis
MSEPRVSVVIVVHNGERYLAAAIESVLKQRQAGFELIVIDDCSTDASLAISRRFEPPVRCISRKRGGIGAARNAGLAASSGEYLAFLDADDLWTPTALAARLKAFAGDPELDIVFGHVREFISPDLDMRTAERLGCRPGLEPGYLLGATLIRRDVFERVGSFRQDLATGEFVDWIARAHERGVRERLVGDHVLWRRLHGSNNGVVRADARTDYARVLKRALDRRRAGYAQKRSR